jgi:dTDP-4-amino-4,6-dideoxygalactose transaminase
MTTGEGGMVVTNDDALYEKLRLLRSHGMTTLTWDRHHGHSWSYDVVELGYNYRIDELRAAIGKSQLAKLEGNNQQRRYLVQQYREYLSEFLQISVPFANYRGLSAAHIMPVLLPRSVDRVNFMEKMKSQGIQTSIHYPPIHKFTAYRELVKDDGNRLPVTEEVARREVTLPLYPGMKDEDVTTVFQAVTNSLL